MSGFQKTVNTQPAPGVEGDFCDSNPRWSVDAGPGGLVAGALGLIAGRFAWVTEPDDADGFPSRANNFGAGPVAGFVHRDMQGLITTYLQESGMTIPGGFQVTLFSGGGFWVKNNGTAIAQPGMKAYANYLDGKATFAATGNPTQGWSASGADIAAATGSFTGSISGDVLTITAVGSGIAVVGGTLSGTGVQTGTRIVNQLSGTPGGVGTYTVNYNAQTVASTTISETYGILTVAGTVTGALTLGDILSGSGVTSGTFVTAQTDATHWVVSPTQTASATAIAASGNIETKWYAMSAGAPGELVKIQSQPLG